MMMIYNHHQSTPLQFGVTGNHEMVGMKCFFQQKRGKLSEKKEHEGMRPRKERKGRRSWIEDLQTNVPLMVTLFGRIVTAPTAASSSWWMGLFLAPQLSEPIHRKWPTCSARLLAFRIPLYSNTHHHWAVCVWGYCLCSSCLIFTLKEQFVKYGHN